MKRLFSLLPILLVFVFSTTLFSQIPAPTNLTVGPNPNTNGAYLHWEYVSGSPAYFKVFRAVNSDDSAAFQERGSSQMTSFIDFEVPTGHTYYYYVRAVTNGAMSQRSNIAVYTPGPPPPTVVGTITGTVLKEGTNEPLVGAWLRFVRGNNTIAVREASVNEQGEYTAQLDTGRWKIQAKREGYLSEWFDNKPEQSQANIVIVNEGQTVTCNFLLAQAPPPPPLPAPTNLTVGINPGTVGVFLHWEYPSGVFAMFKVYRAVDSDDSAAFQFRGSSQITSFNDWETPPGHTYYYYVRAYSNNNMSPRSNIASFTPTVPVFGTISGTVVKEGTNQPLVGAWLRFVKPNNNNASREISIGELGEYSVQLDTGRWQIQAKREGYISEWFDNKPERNLADIVIVTEGQSTICNFALEQLPPPIMGTIGGTIVDDSTMLPLGNVNVCFLSLNSTQCMHSVRTDSFGMYLAEVPVGGYKIKAMREGYAAEYFDNKHSIQEADVVSVTDGGTATANFGLTAMIPLPMVHISGTVTDSSGNPIAGALVAVMRGMNHVNRAHRILGANALARENIFVNGYGRMRGIVWRGETDANGNYNASVRQGGTYIVFSNKMGYFPEYYNNKNSIHEADRLTVHHDTSGINFSLALNPNVQNSISGMVKDSAGNGVQAYVVLVKLRDGRWRGVRHIGTDSLGNYSFNFVMLGNYFVKAFPSAQFAPAWYDAGNCGSNEWVNADTVNANGNVAGIDICVVPASGNGFARVSGTIRDNANNTITGPVVLAISTTTNKLVGFDVAEQNGFFSIENLTPGTYRIVVDYEGMSTETEPQVTTSSSNSFHAGNVNVKLLPATPLVVEEETIPSKITLEQNYPNPFNPATIIRYSLSVNSTVTLKVYNVLGKPITTLLNNQFLAAGSHQVEFDASNLPSGLYYYKLTTSDGFSATKKMTLAK